MLFIVLTRMIARGNTDGLAEKIDIFYAAGRLSDAEYEQLTASLGGAKNE